MKSIILFYLLYVVQTAGADITAEGFERGKVSFKCSHKNARSNEKYFCKKPCKSKEDILLSVKAGGRSESERITLKDWDDGTFNVTFGGLRLTDTGTYWCGVDRMGIDTYTAVHLTVKQGGASETTTHPPDSSPSPTWTDPNDHNSTQQTLKTNVYDFTYITTASNSTNGGGQSSSTGIVLLTTLPAVLVFTILVLAVCLKKQRKSLKPRSQVCTNSTAPVTAINREVECNKISEKMQRVKSPDHFSCTREPTKAPPTSVIAAAESSSPLPIYENISYFKDAAHTAANVREEDNTDLRIYINPLSLTTSERADKGHFKDKANKNMSTRGATENRTERCESKVSGCDSTETKRRSLWFGLDLSGTT